MPEYDNLKIPLGFRRRFEEINKRHNLGYTTYPEFVKDAMRRRFEEIEASYREEDKVPRN